MLVSSCAKTRKVSVNISSRPVQWKKRGKQRRPAGSRRGYAVMYPPLGTVARTSLPPLRSPTAYDIAPLSSSLTHGTTHDRAFGRTIQISTINWLARDIRCLSQATISGAAQSLPGHFKLFSNIISRHRGIVGSHSRPVRD